MNKTEASLRAVIKRTRLRNASLKNQNYVFRKELKLMKKKIDNLLSLKDYGKPLSRDFRE